MFQLDILTITQNMHKLSLQNHATALPHQRGLQCCGPCLLDTPTWFRFFLVEFAPFVREFKEQQFTSKFICMKQASREVGGCFARSCNKAFMLLFCERPTKWKHGRPMKWKPDFDGISLGSSIKSKVTPIHVISD